MCHPPLAWCFCVRAYFSLSFLLLFPPSLPCPLGARESARCVMHPQSFLVSGPVVLTMCMFMTGGPCKKLCAGLTFQPTPCLVQARRAAGRDGEMGEVCRGGRPIIKGLAWNDA